MNEHTTSEHACLTVLSAVLCCPSSRVLRLRPATHASRLCTVVCVHLTSPSGDHARDSCCEESCCVE